MNVTIRTRLDDDLAGVAALLEQTHRSHAYPVILLPDMVGWAAGVDVLEAWVAVDPATPEVVLGHVALTGASPDELPAPQWLAATGLTVDELAVVRRLVVHEAAQGSGIGRALLAQAVEAAHGRGRRPVLDMAINLTEAAALYESAGFERVGQYDLDLAPYFQPGQTSFVIDGETTTILPVVTWIGPPA